ncbi:response regulator transcription factor [Burkholderia metallica]|uniref:response regulator transcription factor n=1 Tax=Burkholderia metallica TaxID=488729 RepID=UPI00157B16A1|nr:response regulator transcription factor [Burkholderia metallica]NTZ89074.1 response regulator transcription factor [Burkholderia metallica]
MNIRVTIVDDHPLILEGVKRVLVDVHACQLVAAVTSIEALFGVLAAAECDVVIVDYSMPKEPMADGVRLIGQLLRLYPDIHVVVLTMVDNPAIIRHLSKLGVGAVVSKLDSLDHIARAIASCKIGRNYLSPFIVSLLRAAGELSPAKSTLELTPRELEVVRLLAAGQTVGSMASKLCRSKKTISAQKMSAMRRLGVSTDAELFEVVFQQLWEL